VGVRNYLIEGVSGAGKTSVAEQLERRGHHVIHGDRKFAYYGDPDTGEPTEVNAGSGDIDAITFAYEHWIWPVDRVKALIADREHPISFFCGHSQNSHHFIHLFDGVFVLELDPQTLDRRLRKRGDDEFGGRAPERELTMRMHRTREDLPADAISIDATAPVGTVVDDILARCEEGER
jgi:broad-specificity NMP kinase